MDFVYFIQQLLKRKWLILGVTLTGVLLAFLLTLNSEKLYFSNSKLATGFTESRKINVYEESFNIFEADVKFTNLIEIVRSESVISMVSFRLLLHELNDSIPPYKDPYFEQEGDLPRITAEERPKVIKILEDKINKVEMLSTYNEIESKIQDVLELYEYDFSELVSTINVSRVNQSDFVTIQYSSLNPELSAFVVNTVAEEYLRYNNMVYHNQTGESVDILEKQVKETKETLDQKSKALNDYKSEHNLVNYDAETQAKIDHLNEYEEQRIEAENTVRKLSFSLSSVKSRVARLQASEGETSAKNSKIFSLRKKIESLNERYLNGGARDQELLREINNKRQELKELLLQSDRVSGGGTDLKTLMEERDQLDLDLRIAQAELNSLNSNISQIKGSISGFAQHEAALKDLQRDFNVASDAYVSAADKFSSAKKRADASGSSVRIVLKGQPAGKPLPSQRFVKMALAGAVCFFLIMVVLLVLAYLDQSVRSPSRLKLLTGANYLGLIPHLKKRELDESIYAISESGNEELEPRPYMEGIKQVRYEMLQTNKQVVLVTSPRDFDGKSFFLINLAVTFAMAKKKVLIIDTNFAHNFVSQVFGIEKSGIKEIEHGEDKVIESIKNSKNEYVDVLGCEEGAYTLTEIIEKEQLESLLAKLKEKYDFILIEGVAMNNSSGAKEVINVVDGVVSIFNAKSVLKESDKHTVEFLKGLDNKFMGVVLNNVESGNMVN